MEERQNYAIKIQTVSFYIKSEDAYVDLAGDVKERFDT